MKTPYGQECKFFYGNYYRGRNLEECRLVGSRKTPSIWNSQVCEKCPVPGILMNNNCPNMVISGKISNRVIRKKMKVIAYCTKSHTEVKDPNIGCGKCHEVLSEISS